MHILINTQTPKTLSQQLAAAYYSKEQRIIDAHKA